MMRRGLLWVAAFATLLVACGGASAKEGDTKPADVYSAVLKQLVPPTADKSDHVVYVTPFADQKGFTLETQVAVISDLSDEATVRFVDDIAEAVDDAPGAPAKGT